MIVVGFIMIIGTAILEILARKYIKSQCLELVLGVCRYVYECIISLFICFLTNVSHFNAICLFCHQYVFVNTFVGVGV